MTVQMQRLVQDLTHVLGSDNVIPDETRADSYLVAPQGSEELSAVFKWANRHDVAVCAHDEVPAPDSRHVRVSWNRMQRIVELDLRSQIAQVQAGVTPETLERELERVGCTSGYDPGYGHDWPFRKIIARGWPHFGGAQYACLEHLVINLDAVLPTGTVVHTPLAPRRATGADLRAVLLGSHDTMGIVTSLSLRIFQRFPGQRWFAYHIDDADIAIEELRLQMRHDLRPTSLGLWSLATDFNAVDADLPTSGSLLIGSFGIGVPGAQASADGALNRLAEIGTAFDVDGASDRFRRMTLLSREFIADAAVGWSALARVYHNMQAVAEAGNGFVVMQQVGKHGALVRVHLSDPVGFDIAQWTELAADSAVATRTSIDPLSPLDMKLKSSLDPKGVLHA